MIPPRLQTDRLLMRLPAAQDAERIAAFYREHREFLSPWHPLWPTGFFTAEYWRVRAADEHRRFERGEAMRLIVFAKQPERVIGAANFSSIVRGAAHYCTLGYCLGEKEQGQGYMEEALRASIRYAFEELRLHRIAACYMPRNERSGRLLRKLGFQPEGYARDYLRIAGQWEDHILTGLINPDWRAPTSS